MGWSAPSVHYERPRRYAPSRLAGDVLVSDGTRLLLASAANRATYGLPDGVAIDNADAEGSVAVASIGRAWASSTGLAAGSAAWARVSSAGRLERVTTPAAADIVMGWAEANGDVHLCPPMTGRMALGGAQVTGISPSPAFVGQTVTVTGSGMGGVDTVVSGGVSVSPTSVTDTQVQFVQPNTPTGSTTLVLVDGGHQVGASSTYLVDHRPLPVSITPSSGYTAGGTAVTISGYQLDNVTSVTIGGTACTSVVVVNSNTVTAVTGAHAAATGLDVVVSGSDGTNTLAGAYSYIQWTPALSDPTGWWEDYGAASWASKASAGTSGGAPPLTNPGAYPGKGTALNGHDVVKWNGRTLFTSSISGLLNSLGPNAIVVLLKVPAATVVAASAAGNPASPRIATDNTDRWSFACGGNNGGGSGAGPVAWMFYNIDSNGNESDPVGSVAPMTADAYHLIVCEWDDTGTTKGMTCTVVDASTTSTASKPAGVHYNGFGPKVAGDANLAFDLATNLIFGGGDTGASGAGGSECINMETAMILTFKHKVTTDATAALLLDYVQRKFGVP